MAAKKAAGSSIVKWDEELAKEAVIAAEMEASTGGGKFISVKGGVLTWNGSPIPGNQLAAVILDSVMENVYYTAEFDPDSPASPECFAFGRDLKTMEPHSAAKEAGTAQDGPCATCEMNKFGSADKGRGKACRNIRRLALIPAGTFDTKGKFKLISDSDYYEKSEIAFFKIPVTSVNGFAQFVKSAKDALGRPPFGLITRIKVEPDPKSQYKIVFEAMQNVPDSIGSAILARRTDAKSSIESPYQMGDEAAAKPAKGAAKGKKKGGRY